MLTQPIFKPKEKFNDSKQMKNSINLQKPYNTIVLPSLEPTLPRWVRDDKGIGETIILPNTRPYKELYKDVHRIMKENEGVATELNTDDCPKKRRTNLYIKKQNEETNQKNSKLSQETDLELIDDYGPYKVQGTGRRKSSVAQINLINSREINLCLQKNSDNLSNQNTIEIKINQKLASVYFQNNTFLLEKIKAPLIHVKHKHCLLISVLVHGGGLVGQADAIKLGISRAVCNLNKDYRYILKLKGYLTQDARVKERKKYGLKKARKAPQFSKR